MTSYTKRFQLPFPTVPQEAPTLLRETANGALMSELLARRADDLVTKLAADWTAELQKPTIILQKVTPDGGMGVGSRWPVLMDTVVKTVNAVTPSTQSIGGQKDRVGWYYVSYSVEFTNIGGGTAASRRRLECRVRTPVLGSYYTTHTFWTDEYWASGAVNCNIAFVTFLGADDTISVIASSQNAASNVNVGGGNTFATATLLCRAV